MTNPSVLCTICARGGSKGVKNKNIRLIKGKPLIAYSIEQAKETKLFEHIVLSTDSDDIAEIGKEYGAEVLFKRPDDLAKDSSPKIPVIRHTLQESEEYYNEQFEIIVDLDVTSPLRLPEDIVSALKQFIKNDNDNLITAMPSRRSPYFNMVELDENGHVCLSKKLKNPVVRRQDAPKCYDMNASIYIWKRDVLLSDDLLFLEKTGLYVMPEERSIDIDNELDFKFVEFILKKRNKK